MGSASISAMTVRGSPGPARPSLSGCCGDRDSGGVGCKADLDVVLCPLAVEKLNHC